jgi:hypothetical protein
MEHYFPWLAPMTRPGAMPRANKRRDPDSPESAPLPPETEALVREYYRYEMELYDFALTLHHAQVAHVRHVRSSG